MLSFYHSLYKWFFCVSPKLRDSAWYGVTIYLDICLYQYECYLYWFLYGYIWIFIRIEINTNVTYMCMYSRMIKYDIRLSWTRLIGSDFILPSNCPQLLMHCAQLSCQELCNVVKLFCEAILKRSVQSSENKLIKNVRIKASTM